MEAAPSKSRAAWGQKFIHLVLFGVGFTKRVCQKECFVMGGNSTLLVRDAHVPTMPSSLGKFETHGDV